MQSQDLNNKKAGELSYNDFHRTEEEAAHRLGQNIQ